jgi:hypothetical protein
VTTACSHGGHSIAYTSDWFRLPSQSGTRQTTFNRGLNIVKENSPELNGSELGGETSESFKNFPILPQRPDFIRLALRPFLVCIHLMANEIGQRVIDV